MELPSLREEETTLRTPSLAIVVSTTPWFLAGLGCVAALSVARYVIFYGVFRDVAHDIAVGRFPTYSEYSAYVVLTCGQFLQAFLVAAILVRWSSGHESRDARARAATWIGALVVLGSSFSGLLSLEIAWNQAQRSASVNAIQQVSQILGNVSYALAAIGVVYLLTRTTRGVAPQPRRRNLLTLGFVVLATSFAIQAYGGLWQSFLTSSILLKCSGVALALTGLCVLSSATQLARAWRRIGIGASVTISGVGNLYASTGTNSSNLLFTRIAAGSLVTAVGFVLLAGVLFGASVVAFTRRQSLLRSTSW